MRPLSFFMIMTYIQIVNISFILAKAIKVNDDAWAS